jgi:hypothetical protein
MNLVTNHREKIDRIIASRNRNTYPANRSISAALSVNFFRQLILLAFQKIRIKTSSMFRPEMSFPLSEGCHMAHTFFKRVADKYTYSEVAV